MPSVSNNLSRAASAYYRWWFGAKAGAGFPVPAFAFNRRINRTDLEESALLDRHRPRQYHSPSFFGAQNP